MFLYHAKSGDTSWGVPITPRYGDTISILYSEDK